ncbi:MAG: GatB/YqeY domain-containing protein [Alphaproteobacteria bacterium]
MRERLTEALKEAMKAKDQRKVSTLRLILAAIKEKDIAARSQDRCEGASEEEILGVLAKMVKQRQESSQTYEEAGRLDLAEQEREEMEIIQSFLPRQLHGEEVREACNAVIAELDASGLKDMGRCMGELKARYAGRMDFREASAIVRQLLAGRAA